MNINQANRTIRLPWLGTVAVPVVMLVATALAIGALIRTSRGAAPDTEVSVASTEQTSIPMAPSTTQTVAILSEESAPVEVDAPPTTALRAQAPPSARGRRVSAPQQRSPGRETAIATGPRTFVGTLSISSYPTGASVSINGKAAGVTPLELPRQRVGSLAVQIAQDGFERWSGLVRVQADRRTEVTATLRRRAP